MQFMTEVQITELMETMFIESIVQMNDQQQSFRLLDNSIVD